ncbi:hypothetical protein [Catellatospora methionotrophica]|uniref:hypothetical protein n=1 Tax=Catellatospora methionotrophica TaxID=121620 RepID=UPI0033FB2563
MSEQDEKARPEAGTPNTGEIPQYARPAVRMMPGPAPVEAEDDAARHSKRRRWTLTTMAVLGAGAVAAAVTLGPTLIRITQQNDAKLTMPEKIGAMVRDDSPAAKDTAGYLLTALAADIELDASASGIYTDPAEGTAKSVMVFGGTTTMFSPERELDTVLKLMEDETGGVTGLKEYEPGDLGGVLKCGSADSPDGIMAVCGWADHGSLALALFPGRTPAESAPLMTTIRTTTLTRS